MTGAARGRRLVLLGAGVLATVAVSMIEAHRLALLIAAGSSADPESLEPADPERGVVESGSGPKASAAAPPAAG